MPFWRRLPSEAAGACGDLGTFLPHVIGAITVAGLAPAGVLAGFGAFFVASGLFYGLPMAVQPMKAVSAVLVTGQAGPGEVAAAGMAIGVILLVLARPARSAGWRGSFRNRCRPGCSWVSACRWDCWVSS